FRPTPRHPTTAQQTSGTADCSRAAPSTAAPSAPNRTPATAEREATAQAGSTAGQVERRAFQIPATVPPAPHPRSAGSTATDDLLEPAPRSSRSRTAHRSSHPNRASDVPHISSRSADYTPKPGPIERLFPHPARGDVHDQQDRASVGHRKNRPVALGPLADPRPQQLTCDKRQKKLQCDLLDPCQTDRAFMHPGEKSEQNRGEKQPGQIGAGRRANGGGDIASRDRGQGDRRLHGGGQNTDEQYARPQRPRQRVRSRRPEAQPSSGNNTKVAEVIAACS